MPFPKKKQELGRTMNINFGIDEISLFDKDFDYDKEFYETQLFKEKERDVKKKKIIFNKVTSDKDIVKIWEKGGSAKVLKLPDFNGISVYPLYFVNFQNHDYEQLKELLGNFFTFFDSENEDVRVTFRNENDLRKAYKTLKKDMRYQVKLDLVIEECQENHEGNINCKKRDRRLLNQWLHKGDVICDTSKLNGFPVQIRNFKSLKFDGLVELFSKYGKFTSIVHSENGCVQVKFSTEDGARECFKDLSQDKCYNVRILFFLAPLNTRKKLVKDVHPLQEDISVRHLLDAEDKIKFTPFLLANKSINSIDSRRGRNKHKNLDKNTLLKDDNINVPRVNHDDTRIVYYPKYDKDGNVYVEGTPFVNPYLSPPKSYLDWRDKRSVSNPQMNTYDIQQDVQHEYYLTKMKPHTSRNELSKRSNGDTSSRSN